MSVTILIVENHDSLRLVLRGWLEAMFSGCQISGASSLREAIALARARLPQVVILDIDLPEMSDYDAVEHIKAVVPTAQIVVLTDYQDEVQRAPATTRGACVYVWKDAMLDQFQSTLVTLLPSPEGWPEF